MTDLMQTRRATLSSFGLGVAGSAILAARGASSEAAAPFALEAAGAANLRELSVRLARSPRRRDFKTTPMVLTDPSQWDSDALALLMAYRGEPKQVWDNTEIDSPWLNLMRNAMNAQIWSFKHPDFIALSATHGTAHLALFDQTIWDKYGLAKMTAKMATNTLIVDKAEAGSVADFENPTGLFSPEGGDSIPVLMRRGVVFLGCHNAIWEVSGKLVKSGANPDRLGQEALAAELTNHLIPGVVLTPGVVATIPELQRAGYLYIK
jgi:hypothetical protein